MNVRAFRSEEIARRRVEWIDRKMSRTNIALRLLCCSDFIALIRKDGCHEQMSQTIIAGIDSIRAFGVKVQDSAVRVLNTVSVQSIECQFFIAGRCRLQTSAWITPWHFGNDFYVMTRVGRRNHGIVQSLICEHRGLSISQLFLNNFECTFRSVTGYIYIVKQNSLTCGLVMAGTPVRLVWQLSPSAEGQAFRSDFLYCLK